MIEQFGRAGTNEWDHETGAPDIMLFANAVQVWSILQDRRTTVADAALAFNVPQQLVEQAIGAHPWMYLDSEVIGHDGE